MGFQITKKIPLFPQETEALYNFGYRSRIAEPHLIHVIKEKQITNDDDKCLLEFHYTLGDCLISLQQLNYEYDTYSTDILHQTIRQLSCKFFMRRALLEFQTNKNANINRYGSMIA